MRIRLTTRILLVLLLLGLGASILTGFFVFKSVIRSAYASISLSQKEVVESTARQIDSLMYGALHSIEAIASLYSHGGLPGGLDDVGSRQMLIDLSSRLSTPWEKVHVFSIHGELLTSTEFFPEGNAQRAEGNPLHIEALRFPGADKTWSSDIFKDPTTQKPVLVFSTPVRGRSRPENPVVGIVLGYYSWTNLSEILLNASETDVFLLNRYGELVVSNDLDRHFAPLEVPLSSHPSLVSYISEPKVSSGQDRGHPLVRRFYNPFGVPNPDFYKSTKTPAFDAYIPSPGPSLLDPSYQVLQNIRIQNRGFDYEGNGWVIVSETSVSRVHFEAKQHAIRDALSTSGIIMVIFVAAFLLLANQISKPVTLIRRGVSRMTHGDYFRPIPLLPHIPSEMRDISNDINKLSQELEAGQKKTEKARQLQRIIDQSEAGYMTCGRDHLVTYFNSSLYSIFTENLDVFKEVWGQFNPDSLYGKKPSFLSQSIKGGEEWIFDPKNLPYKSDICIGSLTIEVAVSAMHDEQGDFDGIAVEIVDVTQARDVAREKNRLSRI